MSPPARVARYDEEEKSLLEQEIGVAAYVGCGKETGETAMHSNIIATHGLLRQIPTPAL